MSKGKAPAARNAALRIAAVYGACAIIWIATSDWLLYHFNSDPSFLGAAELMKGILFVVLTSVLIFILIASSLGKSAEAVRHKQEILEHSRRTSFSLAMAEERERRRIGELIHDQIGQLLSLQKIELSMFRRKLQDEHVDTMNRLIDNIDTTINEARVLAWQISPALLYQFGLPAALQHICKSIEERTGITVICRFDEATENIPSEISILLYRAADKLLAILARNSGVDRLTVGLRLENDSLLISVSGRDAGHQWKSLVSREQPGEQYELFSMSEYINSIGGEFRHEISGDEQSTIVITVPARLEEPNIAGQGYKWASRF